MACVCFASSASFTLEFSTGANWQRVSRILETRLLVHRGLLQNAPASQMKYYYANPNNETVGPVEETDLKALYASGSITAQTNVIPEGGNSWVSYAVQFPSGFPTPPPQTVHQSTANATQRCPYCDEQVSVSAKKCRHCGEILDVALRAAEEAKKSAGAQQPMVFMNAGGGSSSSAAAASSSGNGQIIGTKSRVVAALLAIFLGGIGVHKFYLGQTGWGIVYLLFCWTLIPAIIAPIEGILYLLSTERAFALKFG